MSDEETLRMLRKMQQLAPDMITDDKVQVLFLFHQRQEKTFAGLFEGRCRKCHRVKAQERLTLSTATQTLGTLVNRASSFFGGVLDAPDVTNLLTFHREREKREMAVFQNSCVSCHDPAEQNTPLLKDRVMQISILQGRELDRDVKETIKTQIRLHVLGQTRG